MNIDEKVDIVHYLVEDDMRVPDEVRVGPHPLEDDAGRAVEDGALVPREAALQPDLVPHRRAQPFVSLAGHALRDRDRRDPPRLRAHDPGWSFSQYILSRNLMLSALKCEGTKYEAGSFVQDHKVKSNSW